MLVFEHGSTTSIVLSGLPVTQGVVDAGKLGRFEHWPQDVQPAPGVWRDYYTGEQLDNYTKPCDCSIIKNPHFGSPLHFFKIFFFGPRPSLQKITNANTNTKIIF